MPPQWPLPPTPVAREWGEGSSRCPPHYSARQNVAVRASVEDLTPLVADPIFGG